MSWRNLFAPKPQTVLICSTVLKNGKGCISCFLSFFTKRHNTPRLYFLANRRLRVGQLHGVMLPPCMVLMQPPPLRDKLWLGGSIIITAFWSSHKQTALASVKVLIAHVTAHLSAGSQHTECIWLLVWNCQCAAVCQSKRPRYISALL